MTNDLLFVFANKTQCSRESTAIICYICVKILHFFKLITPYDAGKTTTTTPEPKPARAKQNKINDWKSNRFVKLIEKYL